MNLNLRCRTALQKAKQDQTEKIRSLLYKPMFKMAKHITLPHLVKNDNRNALKHKRNSDLHFLFPNYSQSYELNITTSSIDPTTKTVPPHI